MNGAPGFPNDAWGSSSHLAGQGKVHEPRRSGHQVLGSCVLWNERLSAEQGACPEHEARPASLAYYLVPNMQIPRGCRTWLGRSSQFCIWQLFLICCPGNFCAPFALQMCRKGGMGGWQQVLAHVLGNNCDARSAEKTCFVVPQWCIEVEVFADGLALASAGPFVPLSLCCGGF